jgi:hypothetical protein
VGSDLAELFYKTPEGLGVKDLLFSMAYKFSAYSAEVGHRFRSIPAACSSVFRPPVPGISATP